MRETPHAHVAGDARSVDEERRAPPLPDIALAAIRAGTLQIERVRIRGAVELDTAAVVSALDDSFADPPWLGTLRMIESLIGGLVATTHPLRRRAIVAAANPTPSAADHHGPAARVSLTLHPPLDSCVGVTPGP
jgi:hypothetical protein